MKGLMYPSLVAYSVADHGCLMGIRTLAVSPVSPMALSHEPSGIGKADSQYQSGNDSSIRKRAQCYGTENEADSNR